MQNYKFHKKYQEQITKALLELIDDTSFPKELKEAARYSLETGKRLRPLLLLATLEMFGKDPTDGILPGCSLEMIHTYSLIHDDLPSMDDDDMRRGRPSLHKAFPEWLAVLTGDALLTFAFEILTKTDFTPSIQVELIQLLSHYSGAEGLILGQVIDLSSQNKKISYDILQKMHLGKTASLFIASLEMAAVIAKSDQNEKDILKKIAEKVGVAFQVIDDILDETSTQDVLGKPIGSDKEKNKATILSIIGLEKSKELATSLTQEALELLSSLNGNTEPLKALIEKLLIRKY